MQIPLDRVGLLDDGIYMCRVTETEDRTSQAGNAYVNLTCEVLDDMGRPTDVVIWHTLTMTPKARRMVSAFMDAIGAPPTGTMNSRSLKGKKFWAQVGKDTYQGKSKNVIVTPLTPEQAKRDEDTINNVFSSYNEPDPEPEMEGGFDPNDISTWETEEEDGPGSLPEEMSEDDVKF